MRSLVAWTLALGALAGCAQNGVLELQLMIPPRAATDPDPMFALVQVRRGADHPFLVEWQGDDIEAVRLPDPGEDPARVQLSVLGDEASADLHVKVRFCQSPACDSFADDARRERWFALEQPMYVGRRTSWAACIEALPMGLPTAEEIVDRCQIRGCVRGVTSVTYCEGAGSGAHFCETGSIDEPPRDLTCTGGVPSY